MRQVRALVATQLRRNVVYGSLLTGASGALGVVSYSVNLHYLGYELYGVWAILVTVLSFAQLGNLGIGQAVVTLVSAAHGRGASPEVEGLSATAMALVVGVAAPIAAGIVLLRSPIADALALPDVTRQEFLRLVPWMGVLSGYALMLQMYAGTLTALGRMDQVSAAQFASRLSGFLVSVALLREGFRLESLLCGSAVAYIVLHATIWLCVRRTRLRIFRATAVARTHAKKLVRFGAGVFGAQLLDLLFQPFNKLVLARFAGVGPVAIFDMAHNASMQLRALVEAGFQALTPEMSRLLHTEGVDAPQEARNLGRRALKGVLLAGAPVFAGVILFAPILLKLWLRDRFVPESVGILRIMLFAAFLSLVHVPAYYLLLGLGRVRAILAAHATQGGVNVLAVVLVGLTAAVTLDRVGWAVLAGVAASTLLLFFEQRLAIRRLEASAVLRGTPPVPGLAE